MNQRSAGADRGRGDDQRLEHPDSTVPSGEQAEERSEPEEQRGDAADHGAGPRLALVRALAVGVHHDRRGPERAPDQHIEGAERHSPGDEAEDPRQHVGEAGPRGDERKHRRRSRGHVADRRARRRARGGADLR